MPNRKQLALGLTALGALLLVAGLAWLLGAWVLVGVGLLAVVVGAFGVDF
jgi:hypothetical protein